MNTRTPDGELLPIEERRRIHRKDWYERNKEAILKRQKAYSRELYKTNPEKVLARGRAWYARNRESELVRSRIKNRIKYGLPEPTRVMPDDCECCGGRNRDGRALSLDHCHATGAFRGWLCAKCNLGIGKLGDTAESLQRAIDYLKRSVE